MIPHNIYYCWFGDNEMPELVLKCIDSWKKYLKDYTIHRIDETNFDIDEFDYAREAYQRKHWAFVSDVARTKVLVDKGGIYLDTDVELIQSIDDLISKGAFLGSEDDYVFAKDSLLSLGEGKSRGLVQVVNPGLVMCFESNNELLEELLEGYRNDHYVQSNRRLNRNTIVTRMTSILKKYGYNECLTEIQNVKDITIYPSEYFAPYSNVYGTQETTPNTRSIHHYAASWFSPVGKLKTNIRRKFIGKGKMAYALGYGMTIPLAVIDRVINR